MINVVLPTAASPQKTTLNKRLKREMKKKTGLNKTLNSSYTQREGLIELQVHPSILVQVVARLLVEY